MWKDQFIALSLYNQKMNQKIYAAAGKLSSEELNKDRSAFFKSIWGTLQHILVADLVWLRRYQSLPGAKASLASLEQFPSIDSLSGNLYNNLEELSSARKKLDEMICDFFNSMDQNQYGETLTYKNMSGKSFEKKLWLLFTHLFNHQTHHRGQATTLLTQLNIDVGSTDLPYVINEET
jgi:uncharacterized damage-inducible protein DinB